MRNLWQTPAARDWRSPNDVPANHGDQLPNQVKATWPNPLSTDAEAAGSRNTRDSDAHPGISLTDAATTGNSRGRNWATPQARDHFPGHRDEYVAEKRALGHGMRNLNTEAESWATPKAARPDYTGTYHPERKDGGQPTLGRQAQETAPDGDEPSSEIRRLNPRFVEHLMGFPIGWTDSGPLATPSFRSWRHTHSRIFWSAQRHR